MNRILLITGRLLVFVFLTVLTQIGGVVFLISFVIDKFINKRIKKRAVRVTLRFCSFLLLYSISTLLIVPILAKPFGRYPLPVLQKKNVKPLNFLTCFLNRHYGTRELIITTFEVAEVMHRKFPGTVVNYLDANFPFINGFPLIPHLSHNDGKKLDLAFFYVDKSTGKPINGAPSLIGYGINEDPRPNEVNTAGFCKQKGYWQYGFLTILIPQGNKENFTFDDRRTKEMMLLFSSKPQIHKIFIEPHLKTRLNLQSAKIRFHGCQAVRHDDHIHIQVK